jgi:hypothetical protein
MPIHRRAKLGAGGRLALMQAVLDGMRLEPAAACSNVSPATANRCWHQRLDATARSSPRARGCWRVSEPSVPGSSKSGA